MFILTLLQAFGLAGAAGLNAYIPLFLLGVLARVGAIHLAAPYDALASWPILALLTILLIVEIIVDKVPGADHINDLVQTAIRPAVGALMFAWSAGVIGGLDPRVAVGLGLITALGVHGVKAGARPLVNITTLGLGGAVLSMIEDLISLGLTAVALFMPLLVLVFFAGAGFAVWRLVKRWRSTGRAREGTFVRAWRRRRRGPKTPEAPLPNPPDAISGPG